MLDTLRCCEKFRDLGFRSILDTIFSSLLMTYVLPQAKTNESGAEAEASDAIEKLWLQMQNKRQAGGKPCENPGNFFLEHLIQ